MKKRAILVLSILLAGCGASLYEQSMEQAKLSLAGGEFDKARASFELALEEKPDDPEAASAYKQLEAYNEVETLVEMAQWEEARKKAEQLLHNKKLESSLKEQLQQHIETISSEQKNSQAMAGKVQVIQQLTEEKNYKKAQTLIEELKQDEQLKGVYASYSDKVDQLSAEIQGELQKQAEAETAAAREQAAEAKAAAEAAARTASVNASRKTEYYAKLDRIEGGLADLNYVYESGTTAEMREAEAERFRRWDDALNEIYGVLKQQLPADEMEQLRQAQRKWITYRDETAEISSSEFAGGTWESVQYISAQAQLTQERCYELVDRYMK